MSTKTNARCMEPFGRMKPNSAYIRLPSKRNVVVPVEDEPCAQQKAHTTSELRATKNTVPECAKRLRNTGSSLATHWIKTTERRCLLVEWPWPSSRTPSKPLLLRLVPASHTRPPSIHVPAIIDIVRAELLVQRRLFIEHHKQVYSEGNGPYGGDCHQVGVSEDDPKPNPSSCKAKVHWIPHIAV